jgi:hypothetical protein
MKYRVALVLAFAGTVVAACSSTEASPTSSPPASSSPDGGGDDAGADAEVDAGSPFGDPTCTTRSGTRLKQKWFVAASGARQFSGMYDSQLASTCSFTKAADGKYRCMPDGNAGPIQYSDKDCSKPAIEAFFTCDAPTYWRAPIADPCGGRYSIYKLGAKDAPGGTYYSKQGADCVARNPSDNDHYAVTAVPDDTFAEGTLQKVSAGRISVDSYETTDGARFCQLSRFFDATSDVATDRGTATDGKERLLPAVNEPDGFSDEKCTSPAAFVETDACTGKPPRFTAEETDACDPVVTIRSVGEKLATAYESDGTTCSEATAAPEGASWNRLSAPLDPTTFAEVLSRTTGTGRIQTKEMATPDGFRWRSGLYDTQTKKLCSVPNNTVEKARCIPGEVIASVWFKDTDCTEQIYLATLSPGCASASPPDATTLAWLTTCQPRAVHVGAVYSGKKYQLNGKTCSEVDYPGQLFYEAVDDVDPSTFEELTVVIE